MENYRADTPGLMKRCNGFSLVELLVVIVIAAILFAICLPSFYEWRDRLNYRQTGRELTALIRAAKGFAIETNRQQRVVLDVVNRTYRLQQGSRPILTPDPGGWIPSTRIGNTTTLGSGIGIQPLGVNIATQYTLIVINPNGSMLFTNEANAPPDIAMQINIMDTKVIPAVPRYRIDLTQSGRISGSTQ